MCVLFSISIANRGQPPPPTGTHTHTARTRRYQIAGKTSHTLPVDGQYELLVGWGSASDCVIEVEDDAGTRTFRYTSGHTTRGATMRIGYVAVCAR
eukprot:3632872-Prymnesium_polylepis.1